MHNELVYSVFDIFNHTSSDGALGKHKAVAYYIAPYQRGYKWSSEEPNGAVSVLLNDLTEAFQVNSKEYHRKS